MNDSNKTSRILGAAFVLQFATSLGSAMLLRQSWFVPGDINASMIKIANNAALLQANIIVDMLTALGVIFLGSMLFITLRKQNEKMALTALGFYILEAALLATSRLATFALLRFSQEFVATGQVAYLPLLGQIAFDSMEFVGSSLHPELTHIKPCPGIAATARPTKFAIEPPLTSSPLALSGKPTICLHQFTTCFSTWTAAWLPPPRFGSIVAAKNSASAPLALPLPMHQPQNLGWIFPIG